MRYGFSLLAILLVVICGTIYLTRRAASTDKLAPANAARVGDARLYPDPNLTPGDVLVTDKTRVCQPTYYRSVKDISEDVNRAVYKRYHLKYPQAKDAYEIDRLIPIELGGSNEITNLWPQASEPRPGYHEKDAADNYLHSQVCIGGMSLAEAQQKIATDWYAVYEGFSH